MNWKKFQCSSCWIFIIRSATHWIACNLNIHTCMRNTPARIMCTVICLHSNFCLFHSLSFPSLAYTYSNTDICSTNDSLQLTRQPPSEKGRRVHRNQTIILNGWVTFFDSDIFYYTHSLSLSLRVYCICVCVCVCVLVSVSLRTLQRKEEEKNWLFSVTSVAYAFSLLSKSEYRVLCVQFFSLFLFIILTINIV